MNRPIPTGFPCPACDRYVEPATACPYCGAEPPRRRFATVLRWTALLSTLAGFLGLWLS